MATVSRSQVLSFKDHSLYLWSALFIAGNVLLPQLAHMVPDGGKIFLPIMFFTLIAAARFGIRCGLLTAILSPLVSAALFGMPAGVMLGACVLKSVLIATAIGLWQYKKLSFSILNIVLLVVGYQIAGFAIEGALFFGYQAAWADLLISWPGALLQMVVLWAVTRNMKSEAKA